MKRLEDISSAMIEGYIDRRIEEDGIAPKTANRIREVLRALFTYARKKHGYISPVPGQRSPIDGVDRQSEGDPVITWLQDEEIDEQLAVLEPHPTLHALVATYIFAGLRRSEALWLTTDDVDLREGTIRIRPKKVGGEAWEPKTGRRRGVPILPRLLAILRSYRPRRKGPWFFPAPHGGRWDSDNFSQALRDNNVKHGLEWSCLHFRHTFGSHLAQAGKTLLLISKLMGNSPEICRRHYADLMPARMLGDLAFGSVDLPSEDDMHDGRPDETPEVHRPTKRTSRKRGGGSGRRFRVVR